MEVGELWGKLQQAIRPAGWAVAASRTACSMLCTPDTTLRSLMQNVRAYGIHVSVHIVHIWICSHRCCNSWSLSSVSFICLVRESAGKIYTTQSPSAALSPAALNRAVPFLTEMPKGALSLQACLSGQQLFGQRVWIRIGLAILELLANGMGRQ